MTEYDRLTKELNKIAKETEGMNESITIDGIEQMLTTLDRFNLDYVIIGGFACAIYGNVRATADLDVLIGMTTEEAIKLKNQLENEGIHTRLGLSSTFDDVGDMLRAKVGVFHLDILTPKIDLQKRILKDFKLIKLFDKEVKVVSPEVLLLVKLKAGSYKDKHDASMLLKYPKLDKVKLQSLIDEFQMAELYHSFLVETKERNNNPFIV